MPYRESNIPQITQKDLEDPNLFHLNSVLALLAEQISRVQGGTGTFAFQSDMQFQAGVRAARLPVYPHNVAALEAGLTPGDLYRTSTGEVRTVV